MTRLPEQVMAVSDPIGKGAMIELRVNNERITKLAPLYRETPLNTEPPVAIVVPADTEMAALAADLQERLAALTGTRPPLLSDAQFGAAQELPGHLIALGSPANNLLLRRMHDLQQLTDRDCPEAGLHVVSIPQPARRRAQRDRSAWN